MNVALERASLLRQQNRLADAEQELRRALAADPHDALAHIFLAETLADLNRLDEADSEAATGIELEPDLPVAHFVMAKVLLERNRHAEALTAAQRAVELDSEDPSMHAMVAAVYLSLRQWRDVLEHAELALELDPEHEHAANLRALALTHLGRSAEAMESTQAQLQRNPMSETSHAVQGWAMLHANRPEEAQKHFREALRINPNDEMARSGLLETIKARNPAYRLLLRWFLWQARLSQKAGWWLIIGLWLAQRFAREMAASNPSTKPLAYAIAAAYGLFVLTGWLAMPLSNLLLRLHPLGKHVLSREERIDGALLGMTFGLALVIALVALASQWWLLLIVALMVFLLSLSTAGIMRCDAGWPRKASIGIASVLALVTLAAGVVAVAGRFAGGADGGEDAYANAVFGLLIVFGIGTFIATIANNYLAAVTPQR